MPTTAAMTGQAAEDCAHWGEIMSTAVKQRGNASRLEIIPSFDIRSWRQRMNRTRSTPAPA